MSDPIKTCEVCGNRCTRRKTEMRDTFAMRRFCSKKCNIASHRPKAAAARRAAANEARMSLEGSK